MLSKILCRVWNLCGDGPITTAEALALTHPPIADCARYDALRGSHAAA
jgi:hypothetical protein